MTANSLTPVARKLRRHQTDAERRLWAHLRARQLEGAKFVRQEPIAGYVADFCCRSARLAIELDGGQHTPGTDEHRTRAIEAAGYLVVRFWNNDVIEHLKGVLQTIAGELANARNRCMHSPLTPALSPMERGSHAALRSALTNCSNR